ncbi:MAG: hypothetical protein ABL904_04220 [Hyphomicrobiaceae bacterium]
MEKLIASTLLGATGGLNGGLLAMRALDKLNMADIANYPVLIGMAAVLSGLALVALLNAATPILIEATEMTA